jgi:predicted phosphodiesterase
MAEASFTIQYVSDLHLEFRTREQVKKIIFNIVPRAQHLALAGDIGNPFKPSYAHFLEAMSGKFEAVFVIAGNHEFYGNSVPETHNQIHAICDLLPNVHYLNTELFVDESLPVHIFGGTMWSVVKEEERDAVQMCLNDCHRILGFAIDDMKAWHEEFVERLGAALDFHTDKPFLVISHYLPSYGLIHPDYQDSNINSAFATEVPLANHPYIKAWIYGHTHKARTGPRFFCNPLGYPGENTHLQPVGSVTLNIHLNSLEEM